MRNVSKKTKRQKDIANKIKLLTIIADNGKCSYATCVNCFLLHKCFEIMTLQKIADIEKNRYDFVLREAVRKGHLSKDKVFEYFL